jgi:hypothetical protein
VTFLLRQPAGLEDRVAHRREWDGHAAGPRRGAATVRPKEGRRPLRVRSLEPAGARPHADRPSAPPARRDVGRRAPPAQAQERPVDVARGPPGVRLRGRPDGEGAREARAHRAPFGAVHTALTLPETAGLGADQQPPPSFRVEADEPPEANVTAVPVGAARPSEPEKREVTAGHDAGGPLAGATTCGAGRARRRTRPTPTPSPSSRSRSRACCRRRCSTRPSRARPRSRRGAGVCTSGCAHAALRPDRVGERLPELKGGSTVSNELRAELPGRASALPSRAEATCAPALRASADELRLEPPDAPRVDVAAR